MSVCVRACVSLCTCLLPHEVVLSETILTVGTINASAPRNNKYVGLA